MACSRRLLFGIAALALSAGCGAGSDAPQGPAIGGGRVEPSSAAEHDILKQLETMPADRPVTIGNLVVVAEAPYFAASGRTCRQLHVTPRGGGAGTQRLGCKDGSAWFFAPDVFVSPVGNH